MNDDAFGTYNTNRQIKLRTTMLRPNFCDVHTCKGNYNSCSTRSRRCSNSSKKKQETSNYLKITSHSLTVEGKY